MRELIIFLLLFMSNTIYAQSGIIKGEVNDNINNKPIQASIKVQGTSLVAQTDSLGKFSIENITAGLYNIEIIAENYKTKIQYEVMVDNSKPSFLQISLEPVTKTLKSATVKAKKSVSDKTEDSPLSLRTIGVNEIQRNPGGNRDISKVIQSLPGAGSSVGFRNDIIIRGGGPSENRFFLDGIEIPNINHFATQGANGGPVGILNVDFIKDVSYFAGAFPANRGNSLSSVFEFSLKDPRTDKWHGAFTLGSSDVGIRADGPINSNSALMVSIRRSYLQGLFSILGLPFLPTYNDAQIKYKYKPNNKNEISYIMIGGYDQFKLNLAQNETDENKYFLNAIPQIGQWTYSNGIVWKHFTEKSTHSFIFSRSMLDNRNYKYFDNDESKPLKLDYTSQEIENKFRYENKTRISNYKLTYGAGLEYDKYLNSTYQLLPLPSGLVDTLNYSTLLQLYRQSLFGQISRNVLNNSLTLSFGIRFDANNYNSSMQNIFNQTSPRFSLCYLIAKNFTFNFNTGIYYQLPAYTVLGFSNSTGQLLNRDSLKYIRCKHLVAGFEYNTKSNTRLTIESFYKLYDNYPQSAYTGLSYANTGGNFGVIGNEKFNSNSKGRTFGLELLAQQKLYKGFYGIAAITLVRSQFTNLNSNNYLPSSWDQRFIINLTAGKRFGKNWELGLKYRYTGGSPYTPYDTLTSAYVDVWNANGSGLFDYNNINSLRLSNNSQLDFRIDKKWFFKKYNFNIYLDIQNMLNKKAEGQKTMVLDLDSNNNPQIIIDNPNRYKTKFINNSNGILQPTIGIILEI